MNIKALARKAATVLVVGAGVVFLGLTIQRNWSQIGAYDWQARWGQLALSVPLLSLNFAWSAFVWKQVLDRFAGPGTAYRELLRILFLSKIARYIPGKVWQFVAVGQLSRAGGSPAGVLVSSMMVHAGFVFLSAVITSSVIVAERFALLPSNAAFTVAALSVLALAAAHPKVINACLAIVSKVARRSTFTWSGGWGDSVHIMLLALVNWIGQGVAFFLFAGSLVHLDAHHLLPLMGINAFAFVVGYVAFVAPAGAGVREATMASLLGELLPAGAAAVVAILARLWTIAAELLAVGAVLLLFRQPPGTDETVAPGR